MADVIRYEAEDLRLNGYVVENIRTSSASGGKHISLRSAGTTGTASGAFEGEAGLYDVKVGFFDENDGVSAAKVSVAGDRESFLFDKDLPDNWVGAKTLTSRVTHQRVQLQPKARFTIRGRRDRGEFARFDYIEFSRVKDTPTPEPPAPEPPVSNPQPRAGTSMGTNLAGIADWSTQYPFRDFFKNARDWIPVRNGVWDVSESSTIDKDENGWVKSFSSNQPFDEIATLVPNAPKFDRYVVTYEGEGALNFPNSKVTVDEAASKPGRLVIKASGSDPIDLRVVETDPNRSGDYVRNIQVVPEPFATLPASRIFNPDFLESLEGFGTLRFMDWMNTNFSTQGEWDKRAKPTDFTFANAEGVPVEWMVELANQTGADPWFPMPHGATDEYVRQFARYVKNNLDPKLKAYVEYSNEIWNDQFSQHNYAKQKGRQMSGLGNTPPWVAYHAKRSSEIGKIWDREFGSQKDRAIGVLGSYFADPDISQQAIEFIKRKGESLSEAGIDRLAIAPYFGGAIGSAANEATLNRWTREADGGVSKVFEELKEGGLLAHTSIGGVMHRFEEELKENIELSTQEGVELIAYEGGQHVTPYGTPNNQAIVDLFIKVNTDRRMGDLYKEYFDIWQAQGGDVFNNFNDVSVPSKWGSWGAKNNLYQQSSPKWKAVQETMADWRRLPASSQLVESVTLPGNSDANQAVEMVSGVEQSSNRAEDARGSNSAPADSESSNKQNVLYGEVIDLTQADLNRDGEIDKRIQLTFSDVSSAAGYFNTVGFYKLATKKGDVIDGVSGERVRPGEANYTKAALSQRIEPIDLNRNTSTLEVDVEGGAVLAPFIIANGTVDSLLSQNPDNEWGGPNAYFSFEAANVDGAKHVKGQGQQLQFEDFWGGGDQNFTDFVVSVGAIAID